MRVNKELELIERALGNAIDVLQVGGRLAVISFHSLEDRLVKRYLRRESDGDPMWRGMPQVPPEAQARLALVGIAIRPSEEEIAVNPRARSATLRVAERVRA